MTAADRARSDAERWVELVRLALELEDAELDPPPREVDVTGYDPSDDLIRRCRRWSHVATDDGLVELARFAAGLATTEAEAWDRDDPIIATHAFEERRFLFADRVVHWAVPWADVAGRCHTDLRDAAHRVRDSLLEMGDDLRPAPLLTGDEGLHPPGEDSFGPSSDEPRLETLWSGTIFFAATLSSLTGEANAQRSSLSQPSPSLRRDLVTHFEAVAARWRTCAQDHPGTARIWRDLSRRAAATARQLAT